MSGTLNAAPQDQPTQREPNYAAIERGRYEAVTAFINQNLPTGMGRPLLELLEPAVGLYIPPEALASTQGGAAPQPGGAESAEDAEKRAALADDLDKIADIIEGAASAQPPAATPPAAVKAAKPRPPSRRKGR